MLFITFIENYIEDIAYPNPKNGKMVLPSSFKKKEMYAVYSDCGEFHYQYT